MAATISVGRETLRQQLVDLAISGAVINEVYVLQTQQTGEPDLMGVTVENVEGQYVTFSQAGASGTGSAGMGRIIVLLDTIVAIDV